MNLDNCLLYFFLVKIIVLSIDPSSPVTDIFVEILEVFINTILYTRNVYPKKIFRKRKIYNSSVFVSIFPPLNDYILNVLKSAKELKANQELYRVEVILYKNEFVTYETYVLEVDEQNAILYESRSENDKYLIKFEEDIRKSLLEFSDRVGSLGALPSDVKFKVQLQTTQSAFVKMSHNAALQHFPWLQESESNIPEKSNISILPLTAAQSVGIQIYAEKS